MICKRNLMTKNGQYSSLVLATVNRMLNYLEDNSTIPRGLPTETELADRFGVSRSTVRKVIDVLYNKGIAKKDGQNKFLLRLPTKADYFPKEQLENSKTDMVERLLLKKLSTYELKPGERFSELKLSREFEVNTVTAREVLIKLSQTGLIEKQRRQKWRVIALTEDIITEIAEIRKMLETHAIRAISKLPDNDEIWKELARILAQHDALLKKINKRFAELVKNERAFHFTLVKASKNRFIEQSYNSIFALITYHLWQIEYDAPKIERVLRQHMRVLKALLRKDFDLAVQAITDHLDHAEQSMMNVNILLEKKTVP